MPHQGTARGPRRGGLLAITTLMASLVLGACAPAPTPEGPGLVVQDALARVAAKDLDGLRSLACEGQEDLIRDQLTVPGVSGGSELLPGVDIDRLLDAIQVDVADVEVGEPAIEGEVALVPVGGSVKVSFDADALRPILVELLGSQGASMDEEQIDALLRTLEAYGQDVPLDEQIRLVREGEAWKICQDTLEAPAVP